MPKNKSSWFRKFIRLFLGPELPELPKGYRYSGTTVVCTTCGDNCGQCGNQWEFQRLQREADITVVKFKGSNGNPNTHRTVY
jgi:hypothetical protein